MTCHAIAKLLPGFVDTQLPESELQQVEEHLAACPPCAARVERQAQIRDWLRSIPRATPPVDLQFQLRVVASRERARNEYHRNLAAHLRHWLEDVRLKLDNSMRPVLVPLMGGLASAVVLFSALVPTFTIHRPDGKDDVPTALYQEAGVMVVPDFVLRRVPEDFLVQVEIDERGRLVNYYVPDGHMNADIGNLLLFTTYSPARMFFRPTGGKIVLRRSRINVKG